MGDRGTNSWQNYYSGNEIGHTEWQVTTNHEHPIPADSPSAKTYSPDGEELVKIVLLGAPGVGKTAIVQQFVWGTFQSSYYPTSKKETYYPSVILNDKNYSLKIVDIPDIPFFPVNSFYNISDLQAYGLRDANAYVLVYDLQTPDSFEYINNLFNQINESRDLTHVPVIVVGNKTDKVDCTNKTFSSRYDYSSKYRSSSGHGSKYHDSHHDSHDSFGHHDGGFGHSDYYHHDSFGSHSHHHGSHGHSSHKSKKYRHSHDDRKYGHGSYGSHGHGYKGSSSFSSRSSRRMDAMIPPKKVFYFEEDNFLEKETAEKVQLEWKAVYKECSAQNAESVTSVFKSLMEIIEENGVDDGLDDGEPRKCVIL